MTGRNNRDDMMLAHELPSTKFNKRYMLWRENAEAWLATHTGDTIQYPTETAQFEHYFTP